MQAGLIGHPMKMHRFASCTSSTTWGMGATPHKPPRYSHAVSTYHTMVRLSEGMQVSCRSVLLYHPCLTICFTLESRLQFVLPNRHWDSITKNNYLGHHDRSRSALPQGEQSRCLDRWSWAGRLHGGLVAGAAGSQHKVYRQAVNQDIHWSGRWTAGKKHLTSDARGP